MDELVRVEGLVELRKAFLSTVPHHMQGTTLQKALTAGAKPILEVARLNAPVKRGVLRRAIYAFRNRDSTLTYQIRSIGVRSGKRLRKRGLDAYYWRWVEFGHRIARRGGGYLKKIGRRSRKGAESIGVVPPSPFLRPAFDSQKEIALDRIKRELLEQVEVAGKKASWRTSADSGASSVSGFLR